jgi:hypothetical protein
MLNFKKWFLDEAKVAIHNYGRLNQFGVHDIISDDKSKRGLYVDMDKIDPAIIKKMYDNRKAHEESREKTPFSAAEVNSLMTAMINEKTYESGVIEGGYFRGEPQVKAPPTFDAHNETGEALGAGKLIKINLIDRSKNRNLWSLVDGNMPKDYYHVVSLYDGRQHYYTCVLDLQTKFKLGHEQKDTEPRNKVVTRGEIVFDYPIGHIKIQGRKIHNLYGRLKVMGKI